METKKEISEIQKDFKLFFDLSGDIDTIDKAIQFKDKESLDSSINEWKKLSAKHDVGIYMKNGRVQIESFFQFSCRFKF